MVPEKIKGLFGPIFLFILILFIFSYPNYYAVTHTPPETVYAGQAAWFDPWDINVYTAAIKWSQEYGLNFQNAFTTEVHKPIVVYPLYSILGIIFTRVNPYAIFSAAQIIFGALLLVVLYKISSQFLKKKSEVLLAVFLTSLGGGIGWLFYPNLLFPDIAITPFTFNSIFPKPHEALAVSFYFLSLFFFYLGIRRQRFVLILSSLLFITLVIPFYPYHLLSFYLICVYFAVIVALRKNKKYPLYYFLLIAFPSLVVGAIYSSYLLSGNSFSSVFSPFLGTPNLLKVIIGYGILFPLLIHQLFNKKRDDAWVFINIWFFLSLFLSYLPLPFSRYYLRGLFFPATILVITGLGVVSKRIRVSKKYLLFALAVLVPITGFYIAKERIDYAGSGERQWYYLLKEEKEALVFLDNNAKKGSGVLATYTLGNFIPANTKNRVYFGHYFQTPGSEEKINKLTNFYSNNYSEEEAKRFLLRNNISYVVWGPDEKSITMENSVEGKLKYTFLEKVYANSKVTILSHSE